MPYNTSNFSDLEVSDSKSQKQPLNTYLTSEIQVKQGIAVDAEEYPVIRDKNMIKQAWADLARDLRLALIDFEEDEDSELKYSLYILLYLAAIIDQFNNENAENYKKEEIENFRLDVLALISIITQLKRSDVTEEQKDLFISLRDKLILKDANKQKVSSTSVWNEIASKTLDKVQLLAKCKPLIDNFEETAQVIRQKLNEQAQPIVINSLFIDSLAAYDQGLKNPALINDGNIVKGENDVNYYRNLNAEFYDLGDDNEKFQLIVGDKRTVIEYSVNKPVKIQVNNEINIRNMLQEEKLKVVDPEILKVDMIHTWNPTKQNYSAEVNFTGVGKDAMANPKGFYSLFQDKRLLDKAQFNAVYTKKDSMKDRIFGIATLELFKTFAVEIETLDVKIGKLKKSNDEDKNDKVKEHEDLIKNIKENKKLIEKRFYELSDSLFYGDEKKYERKLINLARNLTGPFIKKELNNRTTKTHQNYAALKTISHHMKKYKNLSEELFHAYENGYLKDKDSFKKYIDTQDTETQHIYFLYKCFYSVQTKTFFDTVGLSISKQKRLFNKLIEGLQKQGYKKLPKDYNNFTQDQKENFIKDEVLPTIEKLWKKTASPIDLSIYETRIDVPDEESLSYQANLANGTECTIQRDFDGGLRVSYYHPELSENASYGIMALLNIISAYKDSKTQRSTKNRTLATDYMMNILSFIDGYADKSKLSKQLEQILKDVPQNVVLNWLNGENAALYPFLDKIFPQIDVFIEHHHKAIKDTKVPDSLISTLRSYNQKVATPGEMNVDNTSERIRSREAQNFIGDEENILEPATKTKFQTEDWKNYQNAISVMVDSSAGIIINTEAMSKPHFISLSTDVNKKWQAAVHSKYVLTAMVPDSVYGQAKVIIDPRLVHITQTIHYDTENLCYGGNQDAKDVFAVQGNAKSLFSKYPKKFGEYLLDGVLGSQEKFETAIETAALNEDQYLHKEKEDTKIFREYHINKSLVQLEAIKDYLDEAIKNLASFNQNDRSILRKTELESVRTELLTSIERIKSTEYLRPGDVLINKVREDVAKLTKDTLLAINDAACLYSYIFNKRLDLAVDEIYNALSEKIASEAIPKLSTLVEEKKQQFLKYAMQQCQYAKLNTRLQNSPIAVDLADTARSLCVAFEKEARAIIKPLRQEHNSVVDIKEKIHTGFKAQIDLVKLQFTSGPEKAAALTEAQNSIGQAQGAVRKLGELARTNWDGLFNKVFSLIKNVGKAVLNVDKSESSILSRVETAILESLAFDTVAQRKLQNLPRQMGNSSFWQAKTKEYVKETKNLEQNQQSSPQDVPGSNNKHKN